MVCMSQHTIDLTHPDLSLLSGHLRMGGANPDGVEIHANSRYLTLGGKPWLPVMGEFHFSRYPASGWRDELLKMKAGGITIAATYIFWIHHEEIEGQFDWSGQRDLRRFVTLCAEAGLYAYPRIGPWAHGECRNGGFPDWLLTRCGKLVRQDAQPYLDYVRRLYHEVARQLAGLLWKEGGPVIGVQLENELIRNPEHIRTLKRLAREAGIEVPLYTMTGWGPAQVPEDEVIPLFGGYPDAFWERQVDGWARECRRQYVFSRGRNDDLIGADLLPRSDIGSLDYLARYPFATCELGGGMQVSYHRRPYITPEDVTAPLVVKLGCGSNLPGYYMYHGGSNPAGRLSTLQESQATGYPNDLPVISYDFQAAIREYGQLNGQYHRMRLVHLFLQDFGAELAPMTAIFPTEMPADLDDRETLRWSVRSDGQCGFVFINNHQRVEALTEKTSVQVALQLEAETIVVPSRRATIHPGAWMIWPFNLSLDGPVLKSASAQLVCRLALPEGTCFVFAEAGGVAAEFAFEPGTLSRIDGATLDAGGFLRNPPYGEVMTLFGRDGRSSRLLLLSEAQALQCWKAQLWGAERLFLSPAGLLFDGERLRLRARSAAALTFAVFPSPPGSLGQPGVTEGAFTRFRADSIEQHLAVEARRVKAAGPARRVPMGPGGVAQAPDDADFSAAEVWEVRLSPNALDGVVEVFLQVDYVGDVARAYLGERLIADDFYNGRVWEIGLSRFAPEVLERGLLLHFLPLREDAPIYLPPEHRPAFNGLGGALQVRSIRTVAEHEASFQAS